MSQSVIRQAHVRYLVSRAAALSADGNATDQSKAEAALRQARRLSPRAELTFAMEPGADHRAQSVAEDISRRLLLARSEPTAEDRMLWER